MCKRRGIHEDEATIEMNAKKKKTGHSPGIVTAAVLVLLAAVLMSGCVRKYTRGDIGSYSKKLSRKGSVTVSEGYREIQEDEEGYLDHLWTVTEDESGIKFHVLDDYYWSMEEVENQLLNDYASCIFLALLERKQLPLDNDLSLKKSEESGLVKAEVVCSFTDAAGLEKCYQELLSLRKAIDEAGYQDLEVPFTVRYENPLRGAVDYDIDEGDTSGDLGSLDEKALAQMRRNYLICALDFRFEDVLKQFSGEEIREVVEAPETVRIYRADDSEGSGSSSGGDHDFFDGVIGSPKYAGISFGTLYELLRIEGRKPEGNAWHYSFKAPDGARIEISYDFDDLSGFNDKRGKLQKGYYYLRDDRKVRMSAYYANHFEASEIEALTGLKVGEDRPYLTEKQEEK